MLAKNQILKNNNNLNSVSSAEETSELSTLRSTTISHIQCSLKSERPYPARVFFKIEQECLDYENTKTICQQLTPKHRSCDECAEQKCQKCEIPVFFRIKDNQDNWRKPKIPKGAYLELTGHLNQPTDKNQRLSFTAYSYQIQAEENIVCHEQTSRTNR